MRIGIAAVVAGLSMAGSAEAAFVGYTVVATNVTNGGQNLTRYEVFASFDGPTDTVLSVVNFQAVGGWIAHLDAAAGFWHKDISHTSPDDAEVCELGQDCGGWGPTMTGNATVNRPYDSFLLIGGNPIASNATSADTSWNGGGTNPVGWNDAQLPPHYGYGPPFNDLGWFNATPSNLQGRVGTAPNTATAVKLGQFILSQDDASYRTYSLRIAVNNAQVSTPVFSDATFTLCIAGGTWYRDLDGDGFGSAASGTLTQCTQPAGYVTSNTDCDDGNAGINPNTVWYSDLEGDGFGSALEGTLTQCTQPAGFVLNNADNCPAVANPDQTDCNSNGIGDPCDLAAGGFDCNANGLIDSCETAAGTTSDCDADGVPDICEGAVVVAASSPLLAPFGNGFPAQFTFANLPAAYRDEPTLTIEATSDLSSSNEFIAISLNGGAQEFFFGADGTDCPATPDLAARTFTLAAFNTLVATGSLTVSIISSGTVDSAQCAGGGIRLRLNYDGIPASHDCNNNIVLDSCEIGNGSELDCNSNGKPDSCDIASGVANDCNGNNIPDSCDIASARSSDLNANGMPDECAVEFVVGGTGYANIQAAIDAAPLGTVIQVGNGTWAPIDLSGKSLAIVSLDGAGKTIIDGADANVCFTMTTQGVGTALLDGFTLRNGVGSYGGGVSLDHASATIRNCIILECSANFGGGIACVDCSATVENCEFRRNSATRGGGAWVGWITSSGAPTMLRNCAFFENETSSSGGGVYSRGDVVLESCILEHNDAGANGGGLGTYPGFSTVLDSTRFCDNLPNNIDGAFTELDANIFSQDCDADGMCDFDEITAGSELDCNTNGFPDDCDFISGAAFDCNENSIPDSCDISSGVSTDVDSNGVPDECKPDCDNDGLPDAWELLQGLDDDCNANSIIDRCEIASAPALDCDHDMRLDSCQILEGELIDCDSDSVPDVCEINSGAEDKNNNGHLDTCELLRGDLNLDTQVNAADLAVLLSFWGAVNPPVGDLTGDGTINAADLAVMLGNWGTTL